MQGLRGAVHYFPPGPAGIDDDDEEALSDGDGLSQPGRPTGGSLLARLRSRVVSPLGGIFSGSHSGYRSINVNANTLPSNGSEATIFSTGTQSTLSGHGSNGSVSSGLSDQTCVSSIQPSDSRQRACTWFNEHELVQVEYDQGKLKEIKKGKKPEKPADHDALLADAPQSAGESRGTNTPAQEEDGEWVGLSYTLALSKRSDCHTPTPGEHSKSREAWAALAPPEARFQEWMSWRRTLDTVQFDEKARARAKMYVDERRVREWLACQVRRPGSPPSCIQPVVKITR
ncbi:hypothetical protein OE88DRAFT_724852 [Heliocybe sulcata]|uniref:Uncharacterized protein n=1 Tax=Heliocybe sulcata TaxID=5364 RepID=A0A5C3NFY9_9AGAM|nr:hypothetical protein OE88DRAFT_724852 [Heliocybe sulcata]